MKFFLSIFLLLSLLSCQTTMTGSAPYDADKVYASGVGIAKYHLYDGTSPCKTAFGLDPSAFDNMVTAVSFRIHEKYPAMTKVGRRGGPYDAKARCVRVTGVDSGESIVVRAIDKCCGGSLASPKTHQLDLSEEAFVKLGPKAKGNLKVKWSLVDCPPERQVVSDKAVCDDKFYFTR